jgi:hypothetical protein
MKEIRERCAGLDVHRDTVERLEELGYHVQTIEKVKDGVTEQVFIE